MQSTIKRGSELGPLKAVPPGEFPQPRLGSKERTRTWAPGWSLPSSMVSAKTENYLAGKMP